ncbi:MAG: DUF167 domain-containing protein [Candidatus Thorarchaeota archaeon]|nr:DUF167 domain-containing protein [Candidatus Thorarchaeota archaeon]
MVKAIWETARGTLVRVIVRPNSKENKLIAEVSPEAIYINLKGPAREGKANSELLKRLSKILKISTGDISLVAGHKSREKTVLIVTIDAAELTNRLLLVT